MDSIKEYYAQNPIIAKLVAELFGTMIIAVVYQVQGGTISVAVIYWMMLLLIGEIGHGYFNPVFLAANAILKKIPLKEAPLILVAQFLGAFTGTGIATGFNDKGVWQAYPAMKAGNYSLGQAYAAEMFATMLLVAVILTVVDKISVYHEHPIIQCTCFAFMEYTLQTSFSNLCGGIFNMAIDVASNLVADENDYPKCHDSLTIYFLAPPVGLILALLTYFIVFRPLAQIKTQEKQEYHSEAEEPFT
mmetsp:Transcript_2885/g.3073  ORF Transcript_2885/g.3073 Transcript_2885/m.3073 type:complete len:246 (+) Transcript_2885:33-770(+)